MLQTVRHARRVAATFPRALAVLLLLTAALPVAAQSGLGDDLPLAILQKDGAWTAAEARLVDTFITTNLAPFADEDADAEAVAAARDALLAPLNDLRAQASFQSQYFRALAAGLKAGLPNYTKIGRINAMMLGSRVVDAAIVPLIETGLTDDWPGVRYAAARSMLVVFNNESLGLRDAEKARLIEKLGQAAASETNGYVAGKFIEGIRNANVPAQRDVLLNVFNARVPLHAADPALTYQPELSAMQELFIEGLRNAGGFDRNAARDFIQAAARYIRLTTAQAAAGVLPAPNDETAANLANQAFTVLDTLAPNAGQAGNRPANPVRSLADDPARAAEVAEQWAAFLQPAPLSFTAEELSIAPPPGTPGSPAPEAPEAPDAPAGE